MRLSNVFLSGVRQRLAIPIVCFASANPAVAHRPIFCAYSARGWSICAPGKPALRQPPPCPVCAQFRVAFQGQTHRPRASSTLGPIGENWTPCSHREHRGRLPRSHIASATGTLSKSTSSSPVDKQKPTNGWNRGVQRHRLPKKGPERRSSARTSLAGPSTRESQERAVANAV